MPDKIGLAQTANLHLKLCVGARVMLTDSISVSDILINGSIDTVKYLDMRSKPLYSTMFVKFDDPKAVNSLKYKKLRGELKEYVPVNTRTKRFPLRKGRSNVIGERKQFPIILGHTIIVHKSQESTLNYMKHDLNRLLGKKLHQVRIISNLYHRGKFTSYFLIPKVVIKFCC